MSTCIDSTVTFKFESYVPIEASPFDWKEIIFISPNGEHIYIDDEGNKFAEKARYGKERKKFVPTENKTDSGESKETSPTYKYQVSFDGYTWEKGADFPDKDEQIACCTRKSAYFFARFAEYFKSVEEYCSRIADFYNVDVYICLKAVCTEACIEDRREFPSSYCECNHDLSYKERDLLDKDLKMFSFDEDSCSSVNQVAYDVDGDDNYVKNLESVLEKKFDAFFDKTVVRI